MTKTWDSNRTWPSLKTSSVGRWVEARLMNADPAEWQNDRAWGEDSPPQTIRHRCPGNGATSHLRTFAREYLVVESCDFTMRKKGQTIIHSEARDVIRRVIQKCDEEPNTGTLQHRLKQSNIRVANYTGISVRSVTSIRKEGVEAGNEALSTRGEKRPYSEEKNFTSMNLTRE
ncbi:hypothetical protein J6590_046590 [Homalodisca vitripennis]|nr:hypothetical protein J6590_046590 [Homalodisca vitripennis]